MRLTFLGTGTSFGIPVVGCDCATCASADPRDRRTRHGALLDLPRGRLLVDTPPELRLQLVAAAVDRIDAVWITHPHADHLHGFDDLRIFTTRHRIELPVHLATEFEAEVRGRFPYIFDDDVVPPAGTTKPRLRLEPFGPDAPVDVLGARLVPLVLPHGPMTVYGFRAGTLGYVTDAKSLDADAMSRLEGVETLVLNALWWGRPHPTHFNVEEAIETSRRIGAKRTWLTHMTHRLRHAELEAELPDDVRPAWDGLAIDLPDPTE